MTAKVVCGSYQHEGYPTEDDKLCTECGGTGYVQPIRETDAGTFTYSGARGQVNYLSEEEAGTALKADLLRYAQQAYADLGSSVPEFGEETRTAIFDTAADALSLIHI